MTDPETTKSPKGPFHSQRSLRCYLATTSCNLQLCQRSNCKACKSRNAPGHSWYMKIRANAETFGCSCWWSLSDLEVGKEGVDLADKTAVSAERLARCSSNKIPQPKHPTIIYPHPFPSHFLFFLPTITPLWPHSPPTTFSLLL